MTTLRDAAENATAGVPVAPERIWATVNGASTRLPDGVRQFIGGWSEDPTRPRAVEYVKASALDTARAEIERLRGDGWTEGAPPSPWSKEWFIAETVYGERVVLTALPEEYTYDFKTADETYIMARNIKRWMPFPDSEYVSPSMSSALSPAVKEPK